MPRPEDRRQKLLAIPGINLVDTRQDRDRGERFDLLFYPSNPPLHLLVSWQGEALATTEVFATPGEAAAMFRSGCRVHIPEGLPAALVQLVEAGPWEDRALADAAESLAGEIAAELGRQALDPGKVLVRVFLGYVLIGTGWEVERVQAQALVVDRVRAALFWAQRQAPGAAVAVDIQPERMSASIGLWLALVVDREAARALVDVPDYESIVLGERP